MGEGRTGREASAVTSSARVVGVHHTGFTVSNLARSVAFYRALGCELVMQQEMVGGYLAEVVGYENANVRAAHLRVPGTEHVLELFEYVSPTSLPVVLEPRRLGNAHPCFVVDDLGAACARLADTGVAFRGGPVAIDSGRNAGGRGAYILDPDGITLELFQLPPSEGSGDGGGR